MSPISPTLTASSSTTAYNPSAFTIDSEPAFDKSQDFSELFDFEQFDSSSSSHSHSPRTISPNHTPSPFATTSALPQGSPSLGFHQFENDDDIDMNSFLELQEKPLPLREEIVVKQEPVEYGFNSADQPAAAPPVDPSFDFNGLASEQQQALQELLLNMMKYQSQYGMDLPVAASPAAPFLPVAGPSTVRPDQIFGNTSDSNLTSAVASTSIPPAPPAPQAAATQLVAEDHDDEPLVSVEEAEARSARQGSTLSSYDDLDSRISSLVPLPTIFSTGRGKGGKKGGGMSSVVRGDDEDLDDDDSWRPSPEEYKKLSSKEKRQLRNKLSARAFRNRRKDYIGTLESHIKDRDTVIDAIKAELQHSRSENMDLRRELAALKSNTMAILHPETANIVQESKPMKAAIASAPVLAAAINRTNVPPPPPLRRAPTPKFDVRKDVPSSPAAFNLWNNSDYLSGGNTVCHTILTPELVVGEPSKSKTLAPLRGFADLPRVNMNPALNDSTPRMPSLSATANAQDLNDTFSDWSENNAFTLRSMDSYRVQMWSRLAREANSEKAHIPLDSRPKFFVEPAYVQAASSHISAKLAASFASAFAGPATGKLDTDKLTAVVTGKAKLKVVDVDEKEYDQADQLVAALSGLKLQTGLTRTETHSLRARENPLGAIGSFFRCGVCPQRV